MRYPLIKRSSRCLWQYGECRWCNKFYTLNETERDFGRDESGFPRLWECGCVGSKEALKRWRDNGMKKGIVLTSSPIVHNYFGKWKIIGLLNKPVVDIDSMMLKKELDN